MTTTTTAPALFTLPAGAVQNGPHARFTVIDRRTADDTAAAGHVNTARIMRAEGRIAYLTARRGNGHRFHMIREYADADGRPVYVYEQAI